VAVALPAWALEVSERERKKRDRKISSSFPFFEGLRGWFPQLRKRVEKGSIQALFLLFNPLYFWL
jgi:hypothetical protein